MSIKTLVPRRRRRHGIEEELEEEPGEHQRRRSVEHNDNTIDQRINEECCLTSDQGYDSVNSERSVRRARRDTRRFHSILKMSKTQSVHLIGVII